MSLFDLFRRSKPETKSNGSLPLHVKEFLTYGTSFNAATAAGAKRIYEGTTAVSVPINKVGGPLASLELVIETDGKKERNHDVLSFLRQPSALFTSDSLIEALGKEYLITGELFYAMLGNINRPPLEIVPVGSEYSSDVVKKNGIIQQWQVTDEMMRGIFTAKEQLKRIRYLEGNLRELVHTRNYSARDSSRYRGQSKLVAASREARQHILGNDHNINTLERGGRVGMVFHFKHDMDVDEFEEAKSRVRSQYGGTGGEPIGVTAGGELDIKALAIANKDMEYAEVHRMARQAVALQYDCPLPLITVEASTMNNYREAKLALYDDATLPLADVVLGSLSKSVLPRFGIDPARTQITYDIDSVTALALRRNEELQLRKSLNVESDNEIRELIGRESYEGGDIIYKPASSVPAGRDVLTDGADDWREALDSDDA